MKYKAKWMTVFLSTVMVVSQVSAATCMNTVEMGDVSLTQEDEVEQEGEVNHEDEIEQEGEINQEDEAEQEGEINQEDEAEQEGEVNQEDEIEQGGEVNQEDETEQEGKVDQEEETDKEPIEDGYTVEVRDNILGGQVNIISHDGQTVIFTLSPEEGYEATGAAWWTVDDEGNQVGELNKLTANEAGEYTFEMPEGNVEIGAVFQDGLKLVGNRIYEQGTSTNNLAAYVAFGDSCLYADETETWVRVQFDARFFEEYQDLDDINVTFELRQHKDKKYIVTGSHSYSIAELKELAYDNEDGTYVIDKLPLHVDVENGKEFKVGYNAYCYMTITRDCWIDAAGEPLNYKLNTSVDAQIIEPGKEKLVPTVFLYNLSANTFSGMLLREYLANAGITFRDITNENLNQNLGFMAGWDGYEAVPEEEAYSPDVYDFTYMIYCNLSEVQVDTLMEARRQDNIKIQYRSVLTEWGAKQSFSEMTKRIQKEDAAFKAALKLGILMTEVRNLDKGVYGEHAEWQTLQASLENAIEVFSQEGESEFYNTAYVRLLKDYLTVTGKTQMEGKVELVLNDNKDGTYTISTKLHPKEGEALKEYTYEYAWYNGTSAPTLTVKREDLYKVTLYLDGTGDTYSFLYGTLAVPSEPKYTVEAGKTSISVTVEEIQEVINMPEVESYVVELYKDGLLVDEQSKEIAGEFIFEALEEGATYTVKVRAINPVGYSPILESTVVTKEDSNDVDNSTPDDSDDDIDNSTPDDSDDNVDNSTPDDSDDNVDNSKPDHSDDDDDDVSNGSNNNTSNSNTSGTTNQNETKPEVKEESVIITINTEDKKIDVVLNKETIDELAHGTVALDMPAITVVNNKADATTITINNEAKEIVSVEIPVANGSVSTVVMVVNADGSETIMRDVIVLDGKVSVKVDGDVVLKLVDNQKAFKDVKANEWFNDAVQFVSSREIFNGTSENTFTPQKTMTRGMLAMVLHNLANSPEAKGQNQFSDVNGAYYADAVKWAAEEGIISGYGNNTFKPENDITREQLAVMLYRFAKEPSVNQGQLTFKDAEKVSTYATEALKWAVENNIMTGKANNVLDPQGKATRAEVATIVMRFVSNN